MRWTTPDKERWKRGFAFLPVETFDGQTVWWERIEYRDIDTPYAVTVRQYRLPK